MDIKRIGIITSGGDCGGLNAVIKGAAQMANSMGIEAVIIPNGYAGLYNLIDDNEVTVLSPERLDKIEAEFAGSEAGNSRVKIKKIDDAGKYERIKKGLEKFNTGGLVISGGDDTGSVIVDLAAQGIACVHAPKTMDLDLQTIAGALSETVAAVVVEISIDIHSKIARKTPVDTGRARVSWDVTEGEPSSFIPPEIPFGIPSEFGRFKTAPPLSASGSYMGALPINKGALSGKEPIFVTSALDYVADLDAGKSKQARGGMVEISAGISAATVHGPFGEGAEYQTACSQAQYLPFARITDEAVLTA